MPGVQKVNYYWFSSMVVLRDSPTRHSQIYLTWISSIGYQMAVLISRTEGEVISSRALPLPGVLSKSALQLA